jgi:dissimilatory sulfite reductase (desulfoviridin) alpha/beta subunit
MPNLSAEELKSLKNRAMMAEQGDGLFTVRIAVVGGHLDAAQLDNIASLARRFATGEVHLTTRQGVEIPHVPYPNLEPLRAALEEAGLRLALAGRCVRGIVACPGTYCKFGQIDTQSLARRLQDKFGSRSALPHKFKISVAGCRHGCAKPQENDLGVLGTAAGLEVFVGGKMGKAPRFADRLPGTIATESQLLSTVVAVLDWYAANGNPGERFGSVIDRRGMAAFLAEFEHMANS